jgi:hypothetical protein
MLLLFLSKNVGLALALNEGIKKINYPWVVRADADDFNFKNRFSVLAREINHNTNMQIEEEKFDFRGPRNVKENYNKKSNLFK